MAVSEPDILVAGETLIDFLPGQHGPLAAVETFTKRPGGAPANVAVGLARLDRTPWFWTRVGDDPFGDFLAATLTAEGLPDRFVERDPDAKTSLAFVSHDETADRAFSFYRHETADTRLRAGTVPEDVLTTCSWVSVGGLTLASEPSRTATFDLVERARAAGASVLFDPNARPELWDGFDFADTVHDVLADVDVAKVTPEDLVAAGIDGSPEAMADAVLDAGPHTVLLTLGSDGALARSTADAPWGATTARHDGYPVTPVDTTGAGDAFTAGALAALADGTDVEELLAFANAVAAVATTGEGAMTALPDRAAVERFRSD